MKRIILLLIVLSLVVMGSSVAMADLTSGLVAYYPFSGNANDATANNNNGTVIGATLTADRLGNADSAYSFNGSSGNYIQVTNQSYLNVGTGFTVALWFRFSGSPEGLFDIIDKSHGDSDSAGWTVQGGVNDPNNPYDNKIAYLVGYGGPTITNFDGAGGPIPTDGGWHHLAGIFDNNTISYYLDGNLIQTNTYSEPVVNNDRDLFIGAHYGTYRFFNGDIDEVRIYDRALSSSEIQQLAAVPLPPSLILLGSGLLSLVGWRKFRKG